MSAGTVCGAGPLGSIRRGARTAGWLGLLTLLAAGACRHPSSPAAQREERALRALYGKDAKLVLKAPPCSTTVTVDTTGWKAAKAQDRPLGFSLPGAFRPDTAPRFIHGGYRWSDGEREFDIIQGQWGPRAFMQDPSDGCRMVLGGHPVLVVRTLDSAERLSLTIWPYPAVPGKDSSGVLVDAVSPSVQDDPLLWTMASRAVQAVLSTQPPPPPTSPAH